MGREVLRTDRISRNLSVNRLEMEVILPETTNPLSVTSTSLPNTHWHHNSEWSFIEEKKIVITFEGKRENSTVLRYVNRKWKWLYCGELSMDTNVTTPSSFYRIRYRRHGYSHEWFREGREWISHIAQSIQRENEWFERRKGKSTSEWEWDDR